MSSRKRPVRRQRRTRFGSLDFEALETRNLLATITVNSGSDVVDENDGVTTLREAINQSNANAGPDTIVFDPNTPTNFTEVVIELDDELQISDDVDIQGLGQFNLVIVANQGAEDVLGDGSRAFNINDGSPGSITVRIADLVISDGDAAGNGGAILSEESLHLERVRGFSSNAQAAGGFLFASLGDGSSLLIDDSIIASNTAGGEGGGIAALVYGGAIDVRNSTISGNVAESDGGGVYIYGDDANNDIVVSNVDLIGNAGDSGGALHFNGASGSATLQNSFVSSNEARQGGGLFALLADDGAMTVRDTVVTGNTAESRGGIGANLSGELTIKGARVSGNTTGETGEESGGIGLQFSGDGTTTIDESVIAGNTASANGGLGIDFSSNTDATVHVRSTTISGNGSATSAAIGATGGGRMNLSHSTVVNNDSDTGAAVTADSLDLNITHTIIADHDLDLSPGASLLDLSYSLIGTNVGTELSVAPVGSPDANGNMIGGATPIDPMLAPLGPNGGASDTHALMVGSPAIDAGNTAITQPPSFDQRGIPFVRRFDGDNDGTSTIDIGAYERVASKLVVTTTDDELDGDYSDGDLSLREAVQLAADSIGTDGRVTFASALNGQTIELSMGHLSINNPVKIEGPGAEHLAVSAAGNDPTPDINQGDGTRVFVIDDNDDARVLPVEISGLTLTGGDVTGEGGAILSREQLVLRSSIVSGNHAALTSEQAGYDGDGGAIWARSFSGIVRISDSQIIDNTSDDDGGGLNLLANSNASIIVENTTVANNMANGLGTTGVNVGGGIRAFADTEGRIEIVDSTISENTGESLGVGVDWGGGGIGFVGSGKLSVRGSTISGNTSGSLGGGIYMDGAAVEGGSVGEFEILNSTITGNNADLGGGVAIFFDGTGVIENSTIEDNTAADGGGIFNVGGMDVSSSTIASNEAVFGGGILNGFLTSDSAFAGELDVLNTTISGNRSEFGGGIFTLVLPSTTSTIRHSTIVNNVADNDPDDTSDGTAGGIYAFYGALDIDHSIIAGNTVTEGGAPDMQIDPNGVGGNTAVVTINNSLIGDVVGFDLQESEWPNGTPIQLDDGNFVGGPEHGIIDPSIGPLADNGGPTKTHALLEDSVAIDSGNHAGITIPDNDQRGAPFLRVVDGEIDMGAFEYQVTAVATGDFDGDGDFDCVDIDALVRGIRDGAGDLRFDLSLDGVVDKADIEQWLTVAGDENIGRPFLTGDANLDGITDARDLNVIGKEWLQNVSGWCAGDLSADGLVDATDLNEIGQVWLQGGPEPVARIARGPLPTRSATDNAIAVEIELPDVSATRENDTVLSISSGTGLAIHRAVVGAPVDLGGAIRDSNVDQSLQSQRQSSLVRRRLRGDGSPPQETAPTRQITAMRRANPTLANGAVAIIDDILAHWV